MVGLKREMTESEMENYLNKEGYSIYDFYEGGYVVDSVKVSDIAIGELGYKVCVEEEDRLLFRKEV